MCSKLQSYVILDCIEGDVRLIGFSYPTEGRVEVCRDGLWGVVCGNGWSNADASTVCRQLGYSSSGE